MTDKFYIILLIRYVSYRMLHTGNIKKMEISRKFERIMTFYDLTLSRPFCQLLSFNQTACSRNFRIKNNIISYDAKMTLILTSYLSWNDLKINSRFFFSSWRPRFIFFDSSSDRGLIWFQRSRSRNFRIWTSRYRARFKSTRSDVRNQLWPVWTRIWTRVWAPAVISWSRCNRASWTRRTRAAVRQNQKFRLK